MRVLYVRIRGLEESKQPQVNLWVISRTKPLLNLKYEIISLMSEQPTGFLDLDNLWDALLSRDKEQVQAAFYALDDERKNAVYRHLQRMVSEPGWHAEQRLSAQTALNALNKEA